MSTLVPALFPALALKMMIAAGIVVMVSMLAERAKPFLAAMIATLPVSAGPSLVFLALDHDDAFMQATLLSAMVANLAIAGYLFAYAHLAQRHGLALSLGASFAAWVGLGTLARAIDWSLPLAIGTSVVVYLALGYLLAPFTRAARGVSPPRSRYTLPLRALAVALLVAMVTLLSSLVGPYVSAFMAAFPIVLSSLIVILQPKIGGPATAAFIASSVVGLAGFGTALAVATASLPQVGRFWALGLGLATALAWNGMLLLWRWRAAETRHRA